MYGAAICYIPHVGTCGLADVRASEQWPELAREAKHFPETRC
jgi:hypothetical protein